MKCEDARELITAVIDGEPVENKERLLSSHLEECENCRKRFEAEKELKMRLKRIFKSKKAKGEVETEILRMIEEKTTTLPALVVKRFPVPLFAGVIAVVIVFALFYLYATFYSPQKSFPRNLLKYSEKLIIDMEKGAQRIKMETSDPEELEQYFRKHEDVTFDVPVQDMSELGYTLIGGNVDEINSIPVAVTIYRNNGTYLLSIMCDGSGFEGEEFGEEYVDEKSGMEFYVKSRENLNSVAWWMGDEICIVVSTLPQGKLIEFIMAGG